MSLVQITKRHGDIRRVKRGVVPVVELDLEENQYVSNVEMNPVIYFDSDRVTQDWTWTAYVVTRL